MRPMLANERAVVARAHERPRQDGADGAHAYEHPHRGHSADANAAGSTSLACRSSSSTTWKTAPVAARVTAPARVRFIASTPAAMPAFACGIAAIAAVDIGA